MAAIDINVYSSYYSGPAEIWWFHSGRASWFGTWRKALDRIERQTWA